MNAQAEPQGSFVSPSLQLPVPCLGARVSLSLVCRESRGCEGSISLEICWLGNRVAIITQLPEVVVFVKKENVWGSSAML